MAKTLAERIQAACDSTAPKTKARNQALAEVQWVLKSDGEYLVAGGLTESPRFIDQIGEATTYSGLDNEELKRSYFETITQRSLIVELL